MSTDILRRTSQLWRERLSLHGRGGRFACTSVISIPRKSAARVRTAQSRDAVTGLLLDCQGATSARLIDYPDPTTATALAVGRGRGRSGGSPLLREAGSARRG